MDVIIKKNLLNGRVSMVSSKSQLHRALIAACFSDNKCKIFCSNNSDDILATIEILKTLGAKIYHTDSYIEITPINKALLLNKIKADYEFIFYCRQSATTLRFLLAIAAILGLNASFILEPSLQKRKIDSIYDFLRANKISLTTDNEGIKIRGKIKSNELKIDASLSSQFLSGLLLGAGIFNEEIKIKIADNEKFVSKGYVLITLKVMEEFSVKIINKNNFYIKPKNSTYKNNFNEYYTEGDFSNAGFFLALGALSGNNIVIDNLPKSSIQPDSIIIDILKRMNIGVSYNNKSVICVTNRLIKPIDLDIINNPDILPVLAVFAAFADGTSSFYNVDRLRIKESDRLFNIRKILKNFAIESDYKNNTLYIKGGITKTSDNSPIHIDSSLDHRMVMLSATLACLTDRDVIIKDAEAVSKSDPMFFKRLLNLGANITYL